MSDFTLIQGNRPTVADTLKVDGVAANLTGATVKFVFQSGALSFAKAAAIVNPTAGTVSYTFAAGETEVIGAYVAQWEVNLAGILSTFPSTGSLTFDILPKLPAAIAPAGIIDYELVRAILGDFHATYQRYSDSAIASVVRTVLRLGEVPGYAVGNDNVSITPPIATAKDLAILVYKSSLKLLLPNAASYAYETRALRERFGEQKQFVSELQEAIYQVENGAIFGSFQSLYAWVNGMTGLNLYGQLTDFVVGAPVATLGWGTVSSPAAATPAGPVFIIGSVAIDPANPALPLVTVDISGHALASRPAAIQPRVMAPAGGDVFECVLVTGWSATEFQVRLLGVPDTTGYSIGYTLIP